jgi:release factor glutamine methyltransferase
VGRASFRYLTLAVDQHVLIPRQETEVLVELVLAHARLSGAAAALDVGTGSGAIALSLASEGVFERIVATDISADALRVAAANAAASSVATPIAFLQGDGFAPIAAERFDVIVSNPPYIAFHELPELPRSVRDWEPATALVCADDGLALTTRLVREAPLHLNPGGLLALEVDERRGRRVLALVEETPHLVAARLHQDLAGRDRFVTAVMHTTSSSGDDR